MIIVNVALWVLEPYRKLECQATDVVAFHVSDSMDGDSARGDWTGNMVGVIRPKLKWDTRFQAIDRESVSLIK